MTRAPHRGGRSARAGGRRAWLALFAVLLATSPARAEPTAARGAGTASGVSDAQLDRRLEFLEERLGARKSSMQFWYRTWLGVMSARVVSLASTAGALEDRDERVVTAVEAGKGLIGIAELLLRPPDALDGAEPIASLATATRDEKLAKLAAAEAALEERADRADLRYRWAPHLGGLLVNAVGGAIIAAVGSTDDALYSAGMGFLGGELQIWTEPDGPSLDWKAYQHVRGEGPVRVQPSARIRGAPLGLALEVRF